MREDYDYEDEPIDGVGFARAGSALRRATRGNPRSLPCPTCHAPNRLTPADRAHGYQCDGCANAAEQGMDRGCIMGDRCAICANELDDAEREEERP